jgi:Tol biopolymer transport system component
MTMREPGRKMVIGAAAVMVAAVGAVPQIAAAKQPVRNGLIAYTTGNGEEDPWAIWTIKPDGTGGRRLLGPTNQAQSGPAGPRWSRDGRKLLFFRGTNRDNPSEGSLWYMTVATKRAKRVPLPAGRGSIQGYDWAPDGCHVVVSLARDYDKAMLYTLRADGTHLKRLRPGLYPSWAGDGKHIVFTLMRRRRGEPWASTVNVVRPDGSGFRRLSAPSADSDWTPSFSPGGTKVLYVNRNLTGPAPNATPEWRRVNVSGRDNVLVRSLPAASSWNCPPQWTPDGRRLATVQRAALGTDGQFATSLVTFNLSGQDERTAFAFPSKAQSGCSFSWQRAH